MKRLLFVLLLTACASAPRKPMEAPPWTSMPPVVMDAMCAKLRGEAMSSSGEIAIVKMTEPLTTADAMGALGRMFGHPGGGAQLADALRGTLQPMPITIPPQSTCAWTPIASVDPTRDVDRMVLQLSSPFVNPYTRKEAGLFARLTLGGRDAQWYWVPLAERNGAWAIGLILPIDLHEG